MDNTKQSFRNWFYSHPYNELDRVRKELIELISPNKPQTGYHRLNNFLTEKIAPKPLEQDAINKYAGTELEYKTGYKPKKNRKQQTDLFQ